MGAFGRGRGGEEESGSPRIVFGEASRSFPYPLHSTAGPDSAKGGGRPIDRFGHKVCLTGKAVPRTRGRVGPAPSPEGASLACLDAPGFSRWPPSSASSRCLRTPRPAAIAACCAGGTAASRPAPRRRLPATPAAVGRSPTRRRRCAGDLSGRPGDLSGRPGDLSGRPERAGPPGARGPGRPRPRLARYWRGAGSPGGPGPSGRARPAAGRRVLREVDLTDVETAARWPGPSDRAPFVSTSRITSEGGRLRSQRPEPIARQRQGPPGSGGP